MVYKKISMKIFKAVFSCLVLFMPYFCLGQDKLTTSVYKKDGAPSRLCFYNKVTGIWTVTGYGANGKIDNICYYDSTGSRRQGTYIIFDENGQVGYILHYKNKLLNGPIYLFYPNGRLRLQGFAYNNYESGTWKEYYPNGELKSIKNYYISKLDSIDSNYSERKKQDFMNLYYGQFNEKEYMDSLVAGKFPDIDSFYNVDFYKDHHVIDCGLKDGCWYYYNYKGSLIRKVHYLKDKIVN
jgi:antitoxin component YwqK of YwqJK toxin-antitoxin module